MLKAMNMLTEDNKVTKRGEEVLSALDALYRKTKPNVSTNLLGEEYLTEIASYRNKFPKMKKATIAEVSEKFAKLFYMNPGLDWPTIQSATDLYLSEIVEEKYTMKASNFIMVQKAGVNNYTILEYIERIQNGDDASDNESDVQMYKIS